jgi:hypothetical protein
LELQEGVGRLAEDVIAGELAAAEPVEDVRTSDRLSVSVEVDEVEGLLEVAGTGTSDKVSVMVWSDVLLLAPSSKAAATEIKSVRSNIPDSD